MTKEQKKRKQPKVQQWERDEDIEKDTSPDHPYEKPSIIRQDESADGDFWCD